MNRWLLAVALISACEAAPGVRGRPSPTHGKRELFGDPSLVPTREGERIRRELAISAELERLLIELGFATASVDVELREPPAVVVIARPDELGSSPPPTSIEIRELVHALVEVEPERVQLHVLPAIAARPVPKRRFEAWAVTLAVVGFGLGLSLGVVGERIRARASTPE